MLEEDAIPTKSSSIIPRMNYTIINTLLRVVKNGLEAKKTVDDAIDRCSAVLNIRESIELCRLEAELEPKEDMKASLDSFDSNSPIRQGLLHLKRYFMIIAFQCYLDVTSADSLGVDIMTFKEWMQSHSEFNLMIQEMEQGAINSLVPVEKMSPGDGIALTTEVLDVVNRRNGGVLARQTILKVCFSNQVRYVSRCSKDVFGGED